MKLLTAFLAMGLPLAGSGLLLAQQTSNEVAWWAVAKEVPALAVLVFVVWIFLREIRRRDAAFLESIDKTHDVHTKTVVALTELRGATERQTHVIGKLENRLGRFMESKDG